MATQNTQEVYPVRLVFSGTGDIVLTLVPENDKANSKLASYFTAHGAKVSVAFTQVDANRGGAGTSSGPYNCLVVTPS